MIRPKATAAGRSWHRRASCCIALVVGLLAAAPVIAAAAPGLGPPGVTVRDASPPPGSVLVTLTPPAGVQAAVTYTVTCAIAGRGATPQRNSIPLRLAGSGSHVLRVFHDAAPDACTVIAVAGSAISAPVTRFLPGVSAAPSNIWPMLLVVGLLILAAAALVVLVASRRSKHGGTASIPRQPSRSVMTVMAGPPGDDLEADGRDPQRPGA